MNLNKFITVCCYCKKNIDETGKIINKTISNHNIKQSGMDITRGICNNCLKKEFPKFYDNIIKRKVN